MPSISTVTAFAALTVFGLGGCKLSEPVVKVPAGDAGALIVLELSNGRTPSAFALALGDASSRPPFVTIPEPVQLPTDVYALHYGCALDLLGLRPGPIELQAGSDTGRTLPSPNSIELARIDGSGADRFNPIGALPAEAERLRIPGDPPRSSPCIELRSTVHRLPGTKVQGLRFFARLDSDGALGATSDGRFIRVDRFGPTALTTLSSGTPHLGAFRRDDGELWLVGAGGAVVHGDPDRGFLPGPPLTMPRASRRVWLDGSRGDPAFELFAVTDGQTFEHFDGRAWTLIADGGGEDIIDRGGVAWMGPGEAIALGFDPERILHYRNGAVAKESLPLTRNDQPLVVSFVPAFGAVIGTALGALLHRKGGGWERIVREEIAPQIRVIGALGDAVVFGGSAGALAQYHSSAGFCPTQVLGAGHLIFLVSFGRSLMLVDRSVGSDETVVIASEVAPSAQDACPGGP